MAEIRFDDGAAYEQMMGIWSRLAGATFLDWLAPSTGLRWIDVGCGNGAFTQLLADRCAPAEIHGIDPSDGQLAFARTRQVAGLAAFQKGDAMALPFPAGRFDAAVMALVLVFVPDPQKGVDEMMRVVTPGGTVAAYMWDMLGGGFPLDPIRETMEAMNLAPPRPPRLDASRMQALVDLWTKAGLKQIETLEIKVQRTFESFEQFWATSTLAPSIGPAIAAMAPADVETIKQRLRSRVGAVGSGPVTLPARAHAVKGYKPS